MKEVFKDYSEYYDLIYTGKKYDKEVDYIDEIIQKNNPGAKTILDLGCGTGIHANLLASKGYNIIGVDFSKEMVNIANKKKQTAYKRNSDKLIFLQHDIRSLDLGTKFDVVVSLFHVFSYLTTNEDFQLGINTINKHLNECGGIAIFDFWYGPGVLTELPTIRTKNFENAEMSVVRNAVPEFYPNKNIVKVNYNLDIYNKKTGTNFNTKETHSMRYYFIPEIEIQLKALDFNELFFYEWITFRSPVFSTFAACAVVIR
jgi:SAM-dependent methyltransferase